MRIDRALLVEDLEKVVPAVGTNVLVPAFQCFQFYGDVVVATDGVLVIENVLQQDCGLNCVVPASQFLKLLQGLRDKEVDIEENTEGNLTVKSVRGSLRGDFNVVSGIQRIPVPTCDMAVLAECNDEKKILFDALKFCRYNVSKDEANGIYCGIIIDGSCVYSTDKYRVARYTLSQPLFDVPVILPPKLVDILLRYQKSVLSMGLTEESQLVVRMTDETMMYSALLEGKYEDLNRFFPDETPELVAEFPESLCPVLERHIAFLKDIDPTSKTTKISIEGNICTVLSKDVNLGVLEESVELVGKEAQPVAFEVNPLFLKDVTQVSKKLYYKDGLILFIADRLSYVCRESA